MEAGDFSLWHYLIFCEEFVNDDCEHDFVCWVCTELVSGHPAFKCLECNFVQHKSCTQLLDLTEMNVEHDIEDRHHLILQEETDDDGKKKVVCAGCGKLASSPAYRCSIPDCAFHLHKSCDQLSHAILHNAHPDHTLILALPPLDYYCDVCRNDRKKRRTTLAYGCRLCNFDMDNKCTSRWDIIKSERKMEAEDFSMWHYLIFCEEFVSDNSKNDLICWVCEESILGHPTFKCLECSFVQHKSCTQLSDLIEMDVKHDITGRHHLILQEETEDDGKKKIVCAGCGKLASSPTYRCSIPHCAFHLHKSCDQLSHAILHNAHPNHTLILALLPLGSYCDVCRNSRKKRRTTLFYGCRLCNFDIDNKCISCWDIIESERKMEARDCSIWHYLIFCEECVSDNCKNNLVCWVCEESILGHPAFKCLECSFVQHKSCTQLSDLTEVDVEHDITGRHHLILQEETEDDGKKKVVCVGCGKLASGPAYRCSIPYCAFHLHKSCDQLSHAILHNAHPDHTLILALPPLNYYCDVCRIDRKKRRTTLAYGCRLCSFDMDNKCTSRWDIIESERKMEAGDCSIWHYLIFCEEFVSDNCENDPICWVCEESILGHPAFKCLECSFVQHKSCTQLSNLIEMDVKHDITGRHHLILQEETEDDGKKKVVCAGCGELASSPAYRCSIPDCAFHLHKSCDQLSHAILHNAHPDHTLILALPPLDYYCDVCRNDRKKRRTTLAYGCRLCSFDMDNKCTSRWDIIESERKMEAGDCSIWHYLIFCEEFVSDNYENDLICWVCEESILGHPAFKCLECSFVQHKLCIQLSDLTEVDVKHDITGRHHLILQEETEDNAKEEVVCIGCREVAIGPTYRCSIPQCTFHLDKSCNLLSHAIQHITHPKHPFILTLPKLSDYCALCRKDREKETTLVYHCDPCDFGFDIKCATSMQIIDYDCDQHKFTPSRKPLPFTCEACGEETKDVACHCSICGVLTHPKCAHFPLIIRIKAHHHLFSRTYCLRQVKKLEKAICKLCCKKVNTECGAYYCQVCDYIVHMCCAAHDEDKSNINSEVTECEDYRQHLVYLVEGLNAVEDKAEEDKAEEDKAVGVGLKIKHNNHPQHELILSFEDFENDKQLHKNDTRCAVCMQFIIFPPFYSCEDCNIFVHKRCAQLPETIIRPLFDENQNTRSSYLLSSTDDLFWCHICDNYRHGLFYKSEYRSIDVQCFLIPETISHKCHGHLLHVPVLADHGLKEICIGCGGNIIGDQWYLMCSDCRFWLCFKCATLPLVARYRYHPHLLKLTYTCEDLEECYCLICEEKRDSKPWFYSCRDCDFAAHIQCVIGSSLKKGNHEHPVVLVVAPKDSPKCHSCEESIRDYKVLKCMQCKFNFHFKCYYS